jgi:hypothetical protein
VGESIEGAAGATTPCVACRLDIPTEATLCHQCGSFQNRWLNWLKYVAGGAALIALAGSLVVYLISAAPSVRRTLWWADAVEVKGLNSSEAIVILNRGDGPVFVSYAIVSMRKSPPWTAPEIPIRQTIDAGHFLSHPIQNWPLREPAVIIRNIDDDRWADVVNRAARGDRCYQVVFYHPTDPAFETVKVIAGPSLRVLDAFGSVVFVSGKTGATHRRSFQAIGTVFLTEGPGCPDPKSLGSGWRPGRLTFR